ncbi:TPA: acyl-CoA thioesterase [Pseudomonas aeruginosa]|nr:acyl-CoA thioesterase [Pseudomonas aeruginosa]
MAQAGRAAPGTGPIRRVPRSRGGDTAGHPPRRPGWRPRSTTPGVHMNFHTRKWVKPEDLNPNGTLFGGSLLRWIDEEAAIYAIIQLGNQRVVTKYISEINFVSSARQGDIIELGITATDFGRTSLTMTCHVRNKITRKSILTIDKMVFINLGPDGLPAPHGKTEITYIKDQFKEDEVLP